MQYFCLLLVILFHLCIYSSNGIDLKQYKIDNEGKKKGKAPEKYKWEDYSQSEWEEESKILKAKLDKMDTRDKDYLATMHQLGRSLYRQGNLKSASDVGTSIVKWHAMMDGRDSVNYAMALSNLANTLLQLGPYEVKLGTLHLDRAVHIMNNLFGPESREATKVKARYYQYNIETDYMGLEQQDYQDRLDELRLEQEDVTSSGDDNDMEL